MLNNRVSQYGNRKKLTVVSEEYNENGSLKELIVDVERNDGTVTSEGTKLDALVLMDNIKSSLLMELYGVDFDSNDMRFSLLLGQNSENIFHIGFNSHFYYLKSDSDEYLDIELDARVNEYKCIFTVKTGVNVTHSFSKDYYIGFYNDSNYTNFVFQLKITVDFIKSTNPID